MSRVVTYFVWQTKIKFKNKTEKFGGPFIYQSKMGFTLRHISRHISRPLIPLKNVYDWEKELKFSDG